jgi:hypothetical protein
MTSKIFSNVLERSEIFFIFILGATARICETVNCESVQRAGLRKTSLTLIVVAVPANTNGFSHLYTNPPVIPLLWRSVPALPIPTNGSRSVGHQTAVSRKPAGFNIWPVHTSFEMREDGYIFAKYKNTKVEKGGERSSWTTGGKEGWQNRMQEVTYLY